MENLYLVCLIPPLDLVKEIDNIRKEIADTFKVYESLKRPAHITLYHPVKVQGKEQDQKFFKALESAAYVEPFHQVLHNFNAFESHTFYLRVDQNQSIMRLQSQIKVALSPLKLSNEQSNLKFTPHLTLAFRDVKPPVFQEIIKKFKDRNFKRSFWVDGFSIYQHRNGSWQPFREIKFKSPSANVFAPTLFD